MYNEEEVNKTLNAYDVLWTNINIMFKTKKFPRKTAFAVAQQSDVIYHIMYVNFDNSAFWYELQSYIVKEMQNSPSYPKKDVQKFGNLGNNCKNDRLHAFKRNIRFLILFWSTSF